MTSVEKFGMLDEKFERLMKESRDKLYKFAIRFTRNKADAEDLLQDTLIKVYMNLDKLDSEKRFMSWAIQIMRRAYLDKRRYDNRRPQTTSFDEINAHFGCEVDYIDPKVDVESEVMLDMVQGMKSRQIRAMMSTLEPAYRESLSLNTYSTANPLDITGSSMDGMDYPAISAFTGVNEGTVKSRISRAKRALALVAKDYGIGHD